jgi:hypothetical protein
MKVAISIPRKPPCPRCSAPWMPRAPLAKTVYQLAAIVKSARPGIARKLRILCLNSLLVSPPRDRPRTQNSFETRGNKKDSYSPPMCAPFSATERRMSGIRPTSSAENTASSVKTSK